MTSKLVVPSPVTVEDDTEENYQDENHRPHWSSTERMSRDGSPPIERVINSFNQELDNLTKSFDDLLSQQGSNKKSIEATQTPYSRPQYSYSTAKKKTPLSRVKDPPPSAERFSPLRNYGNSTPARRSERRAHQHATPSYIPAEPPPAPVETPAFLPTPTTTPNRRRRDDSSTSRHTSTREQSNAVDPQNLHYTTTAHQGDWKDALQKMSQTLSEQENAIRDLERENEMLRRQLGEKSRVYEGAGAERPYREDSVTGGRSHQREDPSPYHRSSEQRSYREDFSAYRDDSGTAPRHYSDESQRFSRGEPNGRPPASDSGSAPRHYSDESQRFSHGEPNGRPPASTSSTYRTTPMSTPVRNTIRSPPRQIHRATTASQMIPEEGFTSGTLFVAELARLMKMEVGHHAPLSVILDKHWDQLKHHFDTEDL